MKRFFYSWILEITKIISKIGLILNLPFLTSLAIILCLRKIKSKIKNKKKTILILEKSHGINDIKQIVKYQLDKNLKFVLLSRIHLHIIYQFFKKKNNQNLYCHYINKVFYYIKKFYNINLIISFNVRYDAERVLQKLDKDLNIKYLVCQKECLFNANVLNNIKNSLINGFTKHPFFKINKFYGDHITVYNKKFKNMITSINYVNEKNVSVVGMNRADEYFNTETQRKNHILFFLVRPKSGLNWDEKNFSWQKLGESALKIVLNFAAKNPDLKFIFKIKILNDHESVSQQKMIKEKNLDNCFVVEGENPVKLILESKFIIAFNSTAIFEGLAAKKKVVIPYFKNDYNKELKEFTIDTSNSNNILHAENEIHLEELLNDLCKDDEKLKYIDSERDNELLEENIGNKDGKSSRRLTKVIESLV